MQTSKGDAAFGGAMRAGDAQGRDGCRMFAAGKWHTGSVGEMEKQTFKGDAPWRCTGARRSEKEWEGEGRSEKERKGTKRNEKEREGAGRQQRASRLN